jgi:hypothetical protein
MPAQNCLYFANKWYFRQIQVQVDNKIINLQNVINSFAKKSAKNRTEKTFLV